MAASAPMGIYDRDYYRSADRDAFGALGAWSCTTWLIVVNVLVFVVDALLARGSAFNLVGPIERWGYFSVDRAVFDLQVWRFATFQFLHAGVGHLALNMLALFFFGPIAEGHFGSQRFLAYYLICGLAGAVAYVVLWATGIVITSAGIPLVGASAGVLGVLVAASQFAPEESVTLLYFPVPLKLRTIVWVTLIAAVIIILRQGQGAGSEAAHLGGIVMGFALVYNPHLLNFLIPARSRRSRIRRKR